MEFYTREHAVRSVYNRTITRTCTYEHTYLRKNWDIYSINIRYNRSLFSYPLFKQLQIHKKHCYKLKIN